MAWTRILPWNWFKHEVTVTRIADAKKVWSVYGKPLPIIWGQRRIGANIIWRGAVTYDSTVPRINTIMALCEGEITGANRVWVDGKTYVALHSSWTQYKLGTRPTQTAWSGITPAEQSLGYPGVAMLCGTLMTKDQGTGKWAFEVQGLRYGTGGTAGDADPALVIADMLGAGYYACGFAWDVVTATGLDGNAASSYARWVEAMGLWVSVACVERAPTADHLRSLLDCTHAEALWSEGDLKIIPLGDAEVVGDVTFSPCTTVRYALTATDLLRDGGADPVEVDRSAESEVFNCVPVSFPDRATETEDNAYDQTSVEDPDPYHSQMYGLRRDGEVSLDSLCLRDAATKISKILSRRAVSKRNLYRFALPWRFCRLEPLDIVTLPVAGRTTAVQILSIKESDDHVRLEIEAEDWTAGANTSRAHTTQSSESTSGSMDVLQTQMHQRAATTWTAHRVPGYNTETACWHEASQTFVIGAGTRGALWANGYAGAATAASVQPTARMSLVASDGETVVGVSSVTAAGAAYSADGDTWTDATTPPTILGRALISPALGVFVLIGATGVEVSTDSGDTWAAATTSWSSWTPVTYGAACDPDSGRIVVIGGTNGLESRYSDDNGDTWTAAADLPNQGTGAYWSIAFGGGLFVVVGGGGATSHNAVSSDGATFVESATPPTLGTYLLSYTGRLFVAHYNDFSSPPPGYYYSADVQTSTNGTTWTIATTSGLTSNLDGAPNYMAWGPSGGIFVGGNVIRWSGAFGSY